MNSLRDLQTRFAADLFSTAGGSECWYLRSDGLQPTHRLDIYRNNVFSNYREALRAVYPVVERLVGERFFCHAVDHYVRAYRSLSGDLGDYGRQFAEFLASFPAVRQLVYLPDVARLEWLVEKAFHAAHRPPLDLARLGQVPPLQVSRLQFSLHPAVLLLASVHPIAAIWRANQADRDGSVAEDTTGSESVLVRREGFEVVIETLAVADFAMLSRLADGCDFGAAYAGAVAESGEFDVGEFLRRHVATGTLADFRSGRIPVSAATGDRTGPELQKL